MDMAEKITGFGFSDPKAGNEVVFTRYLRLFIPFLAISFAPSVST